MTRVSPQIRHAVLDRANGRCEYCRRPLRYGISRFHVDHIIPIERHLGSNDIGNLACACINCNSSKSSDIASYDADTRLLTPLYHPRLQQWNDHFVLVDGLITGITAIRRVTIRILQMNASQYDIELRQYLVELGLW